jgi:hypothetical protein
VSPSATGSATGSAPPPKPLELPDASALVARPVEPKGTPDSTEQPAAQRPQAPRPVAPNVQRRPPTRRLEPGDLICPDCGEGNPTTRKFCSRCGASLETAQLVKAKWWQRLMPGRGPKKRKAGDRPSARKTRKSMPSKILGVMFGGASRVVGVILLVGGLVYGLVPNVRGAVNDEFSTVKNKINSWIHPSRTQILPTDTLVSSFLARHGAQNLTDTKTNTYWEARRPGGSTRLVLTYQFADKFNLKNIAVWNGVGDSQSPDYNSTLRPQHVFFSFPGTTVPGCQVTFGDVPNKASKTDVAGCNANGVSEIIITINDYYPSTSKNVALSSIEFFKG